MVLYVHMWCLLCKWCSGIMTSLWRLLSGMQCVCVGLCYGSLSTPPSQPFLLTAGRNADDYQCVMVSGCLIRFLVLVRLILHLDRVVLWRCGAVAICCRSDLLPWRCGAWRCGAWRCGAWRLCCRGVFRDIYMGVHKYP